MRMSVDKKQGKKADKKGGNGIAQFRLTKNSKKYYNMPFPHWIVLPKCLARTIFLLVA